MSGLRERDDDEKVLHVISIIGHLSLPLSLSLCVYLWDREEKKKREKKKNKIPGVFVLFPSFLLLFPTSFFFLFWIPRFSLSLFFFSLLFLRVLSIVFF